MDSAWELASYAIVFFTIVLSRYLYKSYELSHKNPSRQPLLKVNTAHNVTKPQRKQRRPRSPIVPKKPLVLIKPSSGEASWRTDNIPLQSQYAQNDFASTKKLIDDMTDEEEATTAAVYQHPWFEQEVYTSDLYHEEAASDPIVDTPVEDDSDDERRRTYAKWSITDGETFYTIGSFTICQIFVFGIEYHYCYSKASDETSWDLPDGIRQKCQKWYLVFPKSKRKRYNLIKPPIPLKRIGKNNATVAFRPLGYNRM